MAAAGSFAFWWISHKKKAWTPDALLTVMYNFSLSWQNFEKLIFTYFDKWSSLRFVSNSFFCWCYLTLSIFMNTFPFFPGHILENSSDW